jgi:hypothetical protein
VNQIELEEVMDSLTAQPPPSRVIDLGLAIANGTRLRRRRRVVMGTAIIAAVVAVLPAIGFTLHQVTTRDRGQSPVDVTSSETSPGPSAAPTRFDPLRLRLSAGWTPESVSSRFQKIEPTRQELAYFRRSGQWQEFELHAILYSAGVPLSQVRYASTGDYGEQGELPSPRAKARTPGPTIGGQVATWYGSGANLVWQWAPNAWAEVFVAKAESAPGDVRDIATRYATALRTDANEPVRVPFAMERPPAPLSLISTFVSHENGRYESHLTFSDQDALFEPVTGEPHYLEVSVVNDSIAGGKPGVGDPNISIAGQPAWMEYGSNHGRIVVFDMAGHAVWLQAFDEVIVEQLNVDQARALLASVVITANTGEWTSDPLR